MMCPLISPEFSLSSSLRLRTKTVSLQFSHHISDDFTIILRHEGQMWPVEDVVVIVLEAVVFRQTPQVGVLKTRKILHLGIKMRSKG